MDCGAFTACFIFKKPWKKKKIFKAICYYITVFYQSIYLKYSNALVGNSIRKNFVHSSHL